MKLALLATLSLSLVASRADADCAFSGLSAKPVTPANTPIPSDGGIVIAALPDSKGTLEKGDAAVNHPFQIKGVTKPLARSLAPGLIVMPIPAKTTDLLDSKGTSVLAIKTTTDKPAALVAPVVKAVEFEAAVWRRGGEKVLATIENLPANAIAIVLADDKGTPRSFGMVGTQKGRFLGFTSHSCQALPNGTVPSKPGDRVIVHVVDAFGRLSPASKPMTIVEVKAKAP